MVVGQLIFGPGEAQLRFAIAGRDIRAMLLFSADSYLHETGPDNSM